MLGRSQSAEVIAIRHVGNIACCGRLSETAWLSRSGVGQCWLLTLLGRRRDLWRTRDTLLGRERAFVLYTTRPMQRWPGWSTSIPTGPASVRYQCSNLLDLPYYVWSCHIAANRVSLAESGTVRPDRIEKGLSWSYALSYTSVWMGVYRHTSSMVFNEWLTFIVLLSADRSATTRLVTIGRRAFLVIYSCRGDCCVFYRGFSVGVKNASLSAYLHWHWWHFFSTFPLIATCFLEINFWVLCDCRFSFFLAVFRERKLLLVPTNDVSKQ